MSDERARAAHDPIGVLREWLDTEQQPQVRAAIESLIRAGTTQPATAETMAVVQAGALLAEANQMNAELSGRIKTLTEQLNRAHRDARAALGQEVLSALDNDDHERAVQLCDTARRESEIANEPAIAGRVRTPSRSRTFSPKHR